jgi:hypothetical protein
MSNELLPSPDILAAPLNDVERAENEIVAADRDRDVLVEYVSRRPDTQTLVDTFARLEAVVREPFEASTDISSRLPDLLATIEQIQAVLQPGHASAPDVHFAVERIQDIAMALRQREVEPALCDTLEGAIREVGDAIVRNDAAATRAQGATALLGDLARRVTDLIALAASVEESASEAGGRGVEVEAPGGTTDWFDSTFDRSMTDTVEGRLVEARPVDALMSDDDAVASLLGTAPAHLRLPDKEAEPLPQEVPTDSLESVLLHTEAAREPFSLDSIAPGFAASQESEAAPNAAISLPQPSVDERPLPQIDSRAAISDPLAALHTLSEEELIALFT